MNFSGLDSPLVNLAISPAAGGVYTYGVRGEAW